MFWYFVIGFAVIYGTQTVLGLRQSKNYTGTYTALRRRGRVAIGKKKGLLTTGAIVMFGLDDLGRIVEGTRLTGVTVMARFRPFPLFDGLHITEIDAVGDSRLTGSMRAAVNNARDNYLFTLTGSVPPEPPGPITQLTNRLRKLVGRPAKTPACSLTPATPAPAATPTPTPGPTRRIPVPVRD
ncbi:MAG: transcriptional regulator GutM [Propionicimonas sp.]